MAPADLPKDVIAAYDDAFVKAAASQAVKDYAKTKGAMPIAIYGNAAKELTSAWRARKRGSCLTRHCAKSPTTSNSQVIPRDE